MLLTRCLNDAKNRKRWRNFESNRKGDASGKDSSFDPTVSEPYVFRLVPLWWAHSPSLKVTLAADFLPLVFSSKYPAGLLIIPKIIFDFAQAYSAYYPKFTEHWYNVVQIICRMKFYTGLNLTYIENTRNAWIFEYNWPNDKKPQKPKSLLTHCPGTV